MDSFMTDQEEKKILLKIKKYQLSNAFEGRYVYGEWLDSLNQKQINNFLTIDLERININNNFCKECLINLNLLNSNYYIQDIELISNTKFYYIESCLCDE